MSESRRKSSEGYVVQNKAAISGQLETLHRKMVLLLPEGQFASLLTFKQDISVMIIC